MTDVREPRASIFDRALAKVRDALTDPEPRVEGAAKDQGAAESAPRLVDPDCAVQIFGRKMCAWSWRAVTLVERAGLPHAYVELAGADGAAMYRQLKAETGQSTVPFVFVRGRFIGGFDALLALHSRGELERALERPHGPRS